MNKKNKRPRRKKKRKETRRKAKEEKGIIKTKSKVTKKTCLRLNPMFLLLCLAKRATSTN